MAAGPAGLTAAPASRVLGRKLDSIPFSAYHVVVIAVLGLVGFVEGYDLALTGTLLVFAKRPLHLNPGQPTLVFLLYHFTGQAGSWVIEFAADSPLEQAGFEFPVPLATVVGPVALRNEALNWTPCVRSLVQDPLARTNSPAEIIAAWPTKVMRSPWPRALTRSTQKVGLSA
jgi:hypothetical protein